MRREPLPLREFSATYDGVEYKARSRKAYVTWLQVADVGGKTIVRPIGTPQAACNDPSLTLIDNSETRANGSKRVSVFLRAERVTEL